MIEILKIAVVVIGIFAYLGIILIPAWIAGWRDNPKWLWLLILTIPIGLGVLVVALTCWDFDGWIGINC